MKTKNKMGMLVLVLAIGVTVILSGCWDDDEPLVGDSVLNTNSPSTPTVDDDAIKGAKDAPVTIVEFSDYECPFCARFYSETLEQIEKEYVDTGKVNMVFRDFPLSFHKEARKAAEAAELAGEQGKYWEMHDKLFDTGKLDIASLKQHAKDIGLDMDKFEAGLDSGVMADEVEKDFKDGKAAGVTGTPAFFINGVKLVGAQPFSKFKEVIDKALATGAPPSDSDSATPTGDTFSIPLSDISANAKFYEYDADGTTVKFFAVKASDGSIKTAFDACDVCGYTKKGYRQEGTNMVCNNCGNKYPINGLGTENKRAGGCWPGYLPSKTEGDNIVIQNSDLAEGKRRFE